MGFAPRPPRPQAIVRKTLSLDEQVGAEARNKKRQARENEFRSTIVTYGRVSFDWGKAKMHQNFGQIFEKIRSRFGTFFGVLAF